MFRSIIKRDFSSTTVSLKVKQKIEVQLLKDFEEFGVRGQIIKVLPSKMINYLHPHNGACYVLPGQPPRVPVVEASAKKVVEVKTPTISSIPETKTVEKKSSIGLEKLGLSFSSTPAKEENTSSSIFYEREAFDELPRTITIKSSSKSSGRLENPITVDIFKSTLKSLTGFGFVEREINFYYQTESGQIQLPAMDFAGYYEVSVKFAKNEKPISRIVKVGLESFSPDSIPVRP